MARATAQRICQSGFDAPAGGITRRTRWIRRSAFMKVPSFSNDEHAGRNTSANRSAVAVMKRSCTITSSSRSIARVVCSACGFDSSTSYPIAQRALNPPAEAASSMSGSRSPRPEGSGAPQVRPNVSRPASSGVDPGSMPGSQPMWAAPCTLFWPRNGFTPAPGLPRLPVRRARLTSAITASVPCTCSVRPRP